MTMKAVADTEMVKNALGNDYDALAVPPRFETDAGHALWPDVRKALCDVFDPEIPVNVFELGLIYLVDFKDKEGGNTDIYVRMTLTSPACPVAQEMPGWVQGAILPLQGVGDVDVEIVWDPSWDPSFMAETAKLQLNMFT